MTYSKLLAGAAGLAALAATTPAMAQYYGYPTSSYPAPSAYATPYGYAQPYAQPGYAQPGYAQPGYAQPGYAQPGYAQPYGNAYGYNNYAMNTNVAAQQCSAAVQNRLYNRQNIGSILGALLGANSSGRVLSITQVAPRNNGLIRVRGLASSGRVASNGYGPYGVGAYGGLGYNYANSADLSFRCDVLPNGAVQNVDITRR